MKMKQILFYLFCLPTSFVVAQTFTFDPGDSYDAVLPMESYTDHYIYINHDSQDSAHISWRVVGNTCPEEWLISICDWADCYSYLPNTGDMLPVGQGEAGFTKLTMNPQMVPGNGMIHFWVYPTGAIEEHVDMIYYFSTELVNVDELKSKSLIFPVPAIDHLILLGFQEGDYQLLDVYGQSLTTFKITSKNYTLDLPDLAKGVYFITNSDGDSHKILIQ
jgi:hypothetical protein